MRIAAVLLFSVGISSPLLAWERLVTQDGTEIQGDVTQHEFVLHDAKGGEIAVPRAAAVRFEAGPEGLKVLLKDGSAIVGALQGKLEIEDGLVRRRYASTEIRSVDFDQYITLEKGKEYESCPIRVDLDAGLLLVDGSGASNTKVRAVTCKKLRVASLSLSPNGKIKPGKLAVIVADLILSVPSGEDQLVDLSARLVQGDKVVGKGHSRLTVNEGENANISFKLSFPGENLDREGPPPRVLLQVVSQDDSREVEKGGFFWWFTFPIS